jgi:cell division protease FtsH
VQKVSIIPRGIGALGYTLQRPTEDRFLMSREELETSMAVLMGGRAAEMMLGDDVSTGASDDLAKATDIARGMVLRFGMDAKLGPVAWDTEQGNFLQQPGAFWQPRRYSEETAHEIDEAVRPSGYGTGTGGGILRGNRAALDAGCRGAAGARDAIRRRDTPAGAGGAAVTPHTVTRGSGPKS